MNAPHEERLMRAPWKSRAAGAVLLATIAIAFVYVAYRAVNVALAPERPKVNDPAPDFTATGPLGANVSLTALRGKVVLLDFWATWCPGCVVFTPAAERIHRSYEEHGFVLIGVNQEPGQDAVVRDFIVSRGVSYPIVTDSGAIMAKYGLTEVPSYVLLDREHRIRAIHPKMASEPQLRKQIEALLAAPIE